MRNAFQSINAKWSSLPATARWLIYYAVTLTPNVICILILREHIHVDAFSLVPGLLLLIPLMSYVSKYDSMAKYRFLEDIKYTPGESMTETVRDSAEKNFKNDRPSWLFAGCMVPFMLPFILFFDGAVKAIGSIGLVFITCIVILAITIPGAIAEDKRKAAEKRAKEEVERREQEELESMGRFK